MIYQYKKLNTGEEPFYVKDGSHYPHDSDGTWIAYIENLDKLPEQDKIPNTTVKLTLAELRARERAIFNRNPRYNTFLKGVTLINDTDLDATVNTWAARRGISD